MNNSVFDTPLAGYGKEQCGSAKFSAKFKPPNVKLLENGTALKLRAAGDILDSKCSGADKGTLRDYVDFI